MGGWETASYLVQSWSKNPAEIRLIEGELYVAKTVREMNSFLFIKKS